MKFTIFLEILEPLPLSNFNKSVEKHVQMNIVHFFHDGNAMIVAPVFGWV